MVVSRLDFFASCAFEFAPVSTAIGLDEGSKSSGGSVAVASVAPAKNVAHLPKPRVPVAGRAMVLTT